jgi:hypothetical protein
MESLYQLELKESQYYKHKSEKQVELLKKCLDEFKSRKTVHIDGQEYAVDCRTLHAEAIKKIEDALKN